MRVLIVGGTSFVGRAIAWTAWHHGHEVTVVNRGVTENDLPENIERLVGDRSRDLSALAERDFDATVDAIAYRPSDVHRLADALGQRGGHHLQISSISAYAEIDVDGATESAPLWGESGLDLEGPITGETYGPLKAAAERAAERAFGGPLTFVRPTYVIGAFDATLRFPYWVERARRGGDIVVPGPDDTPMQYVDARDLANFVVRCLEDHTVGAYHVAGPQPPDRFVAMVEQIVAHVAPQDTTLHEVDASKVQAAGLEGKFPLWPGAKADFALALDSSLAVSKGLDLRPLSDSVDDVVSWWEDRPWPRRWLKVEDERRLLSSN